MKKVYAEVKVKILIRADEDASIEDVLNEMDYTFKDQTGKANIEDTEILDWEITDSYTIIDELKALGQ